MNINYDVLNSLSLINENLGKAYLYEEFNPLQKDYALNKKQAERLLAIKERKIKIEAPEFLSKNEVIIKKAIIATQEATEEVIAVLSARATVNPNLQDVISYLNIRQYLLDLIDLNKFPDYEQILDIYRTEHALSQRYSKVMESSYYNKFVLDSAVNAFEELCRSKMKPEEKTLEENINLPKEIVNAEKIHKVIKDREENKENALAKIKITSKQSITSKRATTNKLKKEEGLEM